MRILNYRYLQLASILLFSFFFPSEIRAQTNTVTVGSTSYEVGYVTGSYNENISILTNVLSAPWVGDRNLTFSFVRAYEAQVGTSPFSALTSGTDQLVFIYSPSKEVRLTDSGYVLARSPEALAVARPYRVFAYVISPNSAPTADAGADQTAVASAATVTLDGSGSTDPDSGDTLTYAWSQTAGTTVTLSSATAVQPTFSAPALTIGDAATTLVFSLTVNDGTVDSTADTVSITINAPSATTANAPTALVATAGDGQVSIAFAAPSTDGGTTITDYEYELDDSGTWASAGVTSTPVVITGLTNGTSYSIKLRAVNSVGDGAESAAVTSTPATTPDAPTSLVATRGDAQVSVAFQVPSSDGGAAITDYEYQLDGGTWNSASTTSSPVVITGLTNGTSYSIKLRAVNSELHGAESVAVSVLLGSPASAFEEAEAEVQAIITQDATRSLNSTRSSNQRMTRGARSRFIDSRSQSEGDGAGFATRNNVPFDVDGTFDLAGARLSTKGTFFGQTGNVEGTERRLVFGEFDVQRDGDTGSTTATLTGRVAWEQMISDDTMLGYFVGGELADSNISGAFEGKQTHVAATAGGYAVRALSEALFADGFISIGAGRNNLEMADDVLALESTYTTRTATVGGALTGVYAYERYELRPEMAFSYGKTWIGDVGFAGVAYGLTDNTLSVDAGTVSTASLTLRPEIVWALDAETVADSNAQLSFAPRFICERTTTATTTQNCGAGAEIGLSSNSEDGLSSTNIRLVMDRVGNSNRSNVVFNLEHRF